jgi:pilus assembly protein Flp/PilA
LQINEAVGANRPGGFVVSSIWCANAQTPTIGLLTGVLGTLCWIRPGACAGARIAPDFEFRRKEVNLMTPVTRILAIIDRFRRRDDAQGLAEYALILALIAIVAIVALLFLGTQISDKLSIVGSTLNSVAP